MIKKKVWRYYCEFCGKSGQNPSCIRRHEASCCRNPGRVCFLHDDAGIEQPALQSLIDGLKPLTFDDGLRWLESEADCCPACMLAAILQSKTGEEAGSGVWYPGFDYKSQLREWYSEARRDLNA